MWTSCRPWVSDQGFMCLETHPTMYGRWSRVCRTGSMWRYYHTGPQVMRCRAVQLPCMPSAHFPFKPCVMEMGCTRAPVHLSVSIKAFVVRLCQQSVPGVKYTHTGQRNKYTHLTAASLACCESRARLGAALAHPIGTGACCGPARNLPSGATQLCGRHMSERSYDLRTFP